jgi:hypothetical protein
MDLGTARRVARKRQRSTGTSDRDSFQLGGGQNLVDSSLLIKPGQLLADSNYEMGVAGGYERLGGYERIDGHTSPSAAPYYLVVFRHSVAFTTYLQAGLAIKSFNPAAGNALLLATPVQITPPARNCFVGGEDLLNPGNNFSTTLTTLAESTDSMAGPEPRDYGVIMRGSAGVAPNGSNLGPTVPERTFMLTEQAGAGSHFLRNGAALAGLGFPSIPTGKRFLCSVFVKRRSPSDRRYVKMLSPDTTFVGAVAPSITIDLATGAVSDVSASVESSLIENYGEGWWRCSLWTTPASSDLNNGSIELHLLDDAKAEAHAGDVSKGLYVSGFNADTQTFQPVLGPYAQLYASGAAPLPAGIAYAVVAAPIASFVSAALGGTQDALYDAAGTQVGWWIGGEQQSAAPTFALHRAYRKLAANAARALIAKVPGVGPIRGVWFYNGKVLAWRDDAAAANCHMYKSSGTGWTEVLFAKHLAFRLGLSAGSALVVEGQTVNGATSGATGVVKRVNLTNADWSTNVAKGRLVLSAVTGTFSDTEVLRVGATAVATVVGTQFIPTWSAAGRYRFRAYNFYGASDKRRTYGVNGLDPYFEYDDGDGVLAQYVTGMPTDTPNRIGTNYEMLFLAFPGGSVQNSGVGQPANWLVILGANETTLGDDVTDFLEEAGGAMFVFARNSTFQLLGAAAAVFQLDRFDPNNGALEHTVQRIGFGLHLDDRGFASIETTDKFGNYEANTLSGIVSPLVEQKLKDTTPTASVIYRRRNRYRCFFDDGTFISIGVKGPQSRGFVNAPAPRVTGFTSCTYGRVVRCACSEEDTDGKERIFFGSDDGYVYEAEKGTSFDGEPIVASARLPFHHSGRPDHEKTYRSGRLEGLFPGGATLSVTVELSGGEVRLAEMDISADIGGALYDYDLAWESFNFDGAVQGTKTFAIDADGKNISLLLRHVSDVELPHTLRAVVYQTSMRTLSRETHVG